jgi:hypothetical protein
MVKSPSVADGRNGLPARLVAQVGGLVLLQQPQEDLGDDAAADLPEVVALCLHVGLFEHVVPQRRRSATGPTHAQCSPFHNGLSAGLWSRCVTNFAKSTAAVAASEAA